MTRFKYLLMAGVGVIAAATLATAAPKNQDPALSGVWVFAGYSSNTVTGDATLPVIYDACQIDFGDNARMATTEEWVKSPNITLPAASAWIHAIQQDRGSGSMPDPFATDPLRNCSGWTSSGGNGWAILTDGEMSNATCDISRPVACVVPQ